jgi:phosphoribosyl 1,2-cyclic phosphodiesterase
MLLKCLGSSSQGNTYLLISENEVLVIEAGISFKGVKIALNHNISNVVGLIYTHVHNDHYKYVNEYVKAGIPVYGTNHPWDNSELKVFGEFVVFTYPLIHDVPINGYIINHVETGNILFITDTGEIPYKFANLSQIIVEANYDEDIVYELMLNDKLNARGQNRVEASHLSIQKTLQFLSENDLSKVQNIVLTHLSSGSSNAKDFQKRTELATGKTVTIADKGIEIDFNLHPF